MTLSIRATLKALRIRPARESGDKPVLEVVLRSEVDTTSFLLAAKAGKDMTVTFISDPELQPGLPLDEPDHRVTTVDSNSLVEHTEIEPLPGSQSWEETTGLHQRAGRKRGTRSSESVAVADVAVAVADG